MKIAKFLVIPAIALLIYVFVFPPHYSWRQKLTVTVSTPQGLVEGSAVTQVDVYDSRNFTFGIPHVSGLSFSFTGEAVAVEIAPGRVLFVLLGDEWGNGGALNWADVIWYKPRNAFEDLMTEILAQRGKSPQPLPQKHWPPMAMFDDLSRPETLHIVSGNDLSSWFGPGIKIENMTLAITREPVTAGRIEAILPWLLPDSYTRAPVAPEPAPLLGFSSFLSLDHWRKK